MNEASGTAGTGEPPVAARTIARARPAAVRWSPMLIRLVFLAACAVGGALLALLWHAVVRLPVYTVAADGSATTDERGLAGYIATDATYSMIGLAAGVVIGVVAWRLFGRQGWIVAVIAVAAAACAAVTCWWLGTAIGPGHFSARISAAQAGQAVPIDFQLRSASATLVWMFGAVAPVLVFSSLAREDDDPVNPPRRTPFRGRGPDAQDAGTPSGPDRRPPASDPETDRPGTQR